MIHRYKGRGQTAFSLSSGILYFPNSSNVINKLALNTSTLHNIMLKLKINVYNRFLFPPSRSLRSSLPSVSHRPFSPCISNDLHTKRYRMTVASCSSFLRIPEQPWVTPLSSETAVSIFKMAADVNGFICRQLF